jgi:ParB family chromosome partitioning protein
MPTHDLPLADVFPNPDQPRKIFTPAELQELAASIAQTGLLQPVTVCAAGDGRWMLVCGERRWRAHGLLGWKTIRAEIVAMTPDQIADAAMVENFARKDITPLEEARAFQARVDTGVTVESLATRLGVKDVRRITTRLDLLKLAPEYQDALARGILQIGQAQQMSKLSHTRQRLVFDAIGAGKCKTQAELARVVQAHLDAESQRDLFAPPTVQSHAERERAAALSGRIEWMAQTLSRPFTPAEVQLLAGTTDARAGVLAAKLEILERSLKSLRLELTAALAMRGAA